VVRMPKELSRDEAVDLMFRRHYPELLRLAYCLVGERSHAEDAVQDAFVALYTHWKGLRDRDAAPGYLRAAVLNRCRSRLRDRVRERVAPGWQLLDVSLVSSEAAVVARDAGTRLVQAVRQLPRRQREVVVCRYYSELSVAETALLLEITPGSVKRHTHRAIAALGVSMEVEL